MNRTTRRVLAAFFFCTLTIASHATGTIEIPETRTVTDSFGRSVEIPASPQRIVTAGRSVLMIANALYLFPGTDERLVGVGRINQGRGNFLPEIDERYAEKTQFERNVGAEQVVALSPDLVILKSQMRASLGDQIELVGVPVVYVDFETPEQYERDLLLLGEVLGQPDRGSELARYYATRQREVDLAVREIASDDRPTTLFLSVNLTGGETVFEIPSASWMQTRMAEMAGGDPVWTDAAPGGGWTRVSVEQVAAWDPDVITIVAYRQDALATFATILENPIVSSLRAVREGRAHLFPIAYYSWDQPDVRWILGLRWLSGVIHPQEIDVDMLPEVYAFYEFAYGMSADDVDRVIIPMLEGVDAE